MIEAAFEGHLKIVMCLAEAGADINTRSNNIWTPVMWAANGGHREIVKWLIDAGAIVQGRT